MQITLRAKGAISGVELFQVTVNADGRWWYESRGVELAEGRLSSADLAQFKGLYDKVEWDLEVLNGPTGRADRTHFEMEVIHDGGDRRLYQFTENLAHRSWQFRDLVHFLRHNAATGADPAGFAPDRPGEQPTTHL